MSKTAVIHIGSGKTGSTSIQRTLYKNKEKNDKALFYPTLLDNKNNQIFRFAFCELINTPSNIRDRFKNNHKAFISYQNDILKSFKKEIKDKDNIIISSEFLFLSNINEIKKISKFIHQLGFKQIHIIVYIRNPADYYLSLAQQSIKNSHSIPSPTKFKYEMTESILNWSSICSGNIIVREFNRNKLKNNNVIDDFKNTIKEKIGINIDLTTKESSNESLSSEGAYAIQVIQESIAKSNSLDKKLEKEKLKKIIYSLPNGTKPQLKNTIRNIILFRFRNEIKKIKEKFSLFDDINPPKNQEINCDFKNIRLIDIMEEFEHKNYVNSLKKIIHTLES